MKNVISALVAIQGCFIWNGVGLPLLNLISTVARELLGTILFNYVFLVLYVAVVLFVKMKYKKHSELMENISGSSGKPIRETVEEIILFSLVAGFIGSIAVVTIGITLDIVVFEYLFFIMLLLALVNARYLCLSYAGGILAIAGIVFGIGKIDIPSLLALVAVMHLMESVLIFFYGAKDSVPVLIKDDKGITGAFLTQKFWPVPIVFITSVIGTENNGIKDLIKGKWWPLFKPEDYFTGLLVLGLGCLIAVLGYTDMTATRQPEKKSRETSVLIFCYSAMMLLISILSMKIYMLRIAGALFCIIAHEGIVIYGIRKEKKEEAIFRPVRRGLKVLDILPGSHAQKMGMQRGDIILSVNGRDIQTEEGLNEALRGFPVFAWIYVTCQGGKEKTYEYKCYPGGFNQLGIISVPREKEITYNIDYFENLVIIKNLVARFKGINKSV